MKTVLFGATLTTLALLYGILAIIVIIVFSLLEIPIIYALLGSITILIIQFLLSPPTTDFVMKWLYKAEFGKEIPEYLKKFIEESCKKHNMKYPKIAVIDDGAPNAFTYGMGKNSARIVITRGLYELLTEEEVKAVVAHELGHATHYDMAIITVAQVVPFVLHAVYEMTKKNNSNDSSADKVGYIALVFYVISEYLILWLSRSREYYADSFAIEETKNPTALAEALVKIGFGLSINSTGKVKSNALGIFDVKASKSLAITAYNENGGVSKEKIKNAMKWEKWNPWAKIYEFGSTHPLISKRILKISERCKEFNQEKYIDFDIKKPESYADDFIKEIAICIFPALTLIIAIIVALLYSIKVTFLIGIDISLIIGVALIVIAITSYLKLRYTHKNKNYKETTVSDLLSEVKVSQITSIPCSLTGNVIGRGNPGYIFNEDFVLKDKTGIIFLDYNQPLFVIEKIFALFKSPEYFNKEIKIKGWYRRNPVPYIELYELVIDGKVKKCHTYTFVKVMYALLFIAGIVLIII